MVSIFSGHKTKSTLNDNAKTKNERNKIPITLKSPHRFFPGLIKAVNKPVKNPPLNKQNGPLGIPALINLILTKSTLIPLT